MNKFKKLLLTLAPLSVVAIATPIILTSCSTNAISPSKPSDPSKPGGGEETKPGDSVTPDLTNDDKFQPNKQGLYKKVEETIKAGKPGEEEAKVAEAFTQYANPTEQDVKDAINIWSFNKWNSTKDKNITFKSNLNFEKVTSNKKEGENKTKWEISFKYSFQITSTIEGKTENVLGEKVFTLSNVELSSNVTFNTNASKLMVNGVSKLDDLKSSKSLYRETNQNESQVVQDVKTFLKTTTSNFDSQVNFKTFIKVKNIVGQQLENPIWDPQKVKDYPILTIDENTVTLPLRSGENAAWENASSTTPYNEIKTKFSKPKVQKIIISLIDSKDYEKPTLTLGNEVVDGANSNMDITITFKKKTDKEGMDSNPKLIFKVKGFKKTIQ